MPFTGKATYSAGAALPELLEDVADIISIISPHETPLLDHLGDAPRTALSTIHEWVEDSLLPNTGQINQATFIPDPLTATLITVDDAKVFQVGDLLRPGQSAEVMLITGITLNTLTVVRAYGGTTATALADNMVLTILSNAALEGADAAPARFTNRVRRSNYTQIFSATVEVSGSMQAARAHGVADELDYQKQERLRELLRDLENTVINGVASTTDPQGAANTRRSMNGILRQLTNIYMPGVGDIPDGGGPGNDELNEAVLNAALRELWEQSSATIDTIVVGGSQKRRINAFITASRAFGPADERFKDLVSLYESDFGVARVILSRWVPPDAALLLDSSRLAVLPLAGRSFGLKQLASNGDATRAQVLGEYTLEMRNPLAHGVIRSLAV